MLAIPIDKLLQRMDEIEKESLNGVARWRKLREQLEDEAAQQDEVCPECECELHLTTDGKQVCRNESCKRYLTAGSES